MRSQDRHIGESPTHAPAVREMWDPTRVSEDDIVRNFDLTDALEPSLDDETERLRLQVGLGPRPKKRFQTGDVVISRLALLPQGDSRRANVEHAAQRGIVRIHRASPYGERALAETLMVFPPVPACGDGPEVVTGREQPPATSTEEDLLAIPVPDALERIQKKIDTLVHESINARRESYRLLDEAKKTVENTIAGDATRVRG